MLKHWFLLEEKKPERRSCPWEREIAGVEFVKWMAVDVVLLVQSDGGKRRAVWAPYPPQS